MWTWDLAAIELLAVTENVADLMIDRLHRVSPETKTLLSLVARNCETRPFRPERLRLSSKPSIFGVGLDLIGVAAWKATWKWSTWNERPRETFI